MKKLLSIVVVGVLCAGALAQDGIYGSFLLGYKHLDLDPLNNRLAQMNNLTLSEGFNNSSMILGGEGHLILAERLVLGFTGFGRANGRQILDSVLITFPNGSGQVMAPQRLQFNGAVLMGVLGLNLIKENRLGWHLFPRVGVGASGFTLQKKVVYPVEYYTTGSTPGTPQGAFESILSTDDGISVLRKFGLAIDPGIGFDWYKPFKNFFTFIPGLDVGLMAHFDIGWIIMPVRTNWFREISSIEEYEPDVKYDGLHMHFGVGLGLSPK